MGKEERRNRKKAGNSNNVAVTASDHYDPNIDDIPDSEKFRLIEQSGLFKDLSSTQREILDLKSDKNSSSSKLEVIRQDEEPHFGWGFQAILYTIPLCSVYSVMDILIHRQFNEDPTFWPFFTRVVKIAPIVYLLVYFTNKNLTKPWLQFLMFIGSIGCGCHLIWVINKVSYFGVMRRCPPLATLWIYFVAQLRLFPAVVSLITVYLYFRFGDPHFKI
ncbi:2014_t:CDS:2 [Ambispora gerdemannii]|uniref:2014_t:CDS:1 n=1 Tax=Ambispora gerdemannii TaxID=144530 RepID=A0A9N9BF93_9GLOM|nr:2014_t:CDS:2 [Ambispora gerdemannii]